MDTQDIIAHIEAHAKVTGLKPTTIGQMAVRNRTIYEKLVRGGDIQLRTASALLDWMRADLARRGLSTVAPTGSAPVPGASRSTALPARKDVGAESQNDKGAA